MEDISGLCTLSSIVDDVINEMGLSESEYIRLLRVAERGLMKINLNAIGGVSTQKIEVDEKTLTSPLPRDFAMFLKLGVIVNGKLYPLTMNDNIQINRDIDCDTVISQKDGAHYPLNRYSTRGGLPEIGNYRINSKMNRIEFSSNLNYKSLILEYVSTGLNATGETYVPAIARETLIAWTIWKYVEYTAKYQNRIQYAESRFNSEYLNMRELMMPTLDEMQDAFRQTLRQTI